MNNYMKHSFSQILNSADLNTDVHYFRRLKV